MAEYFAGMEAGGTKFVCTIGDSSGQILAEERFPTTYPQETIDRSISFFLNKKTDWDIQLTSLGIGCFGPIDLDRSSSSYGHITSTPKPGWVNANIVGPLSEALHVPIAFDTDVNAAALGELKWGAGVNLENFIYFTIGTGIGGGAIINGKPLHGLIHPEMGHIFLNPNPDDTYKGKCPYHRNCFEGLASGPAISERWNTSPQSIPTDHPAWDMEADYIAQAMSSLICSFSPQKIILGGGVMKQYHLFPKVQRLTQVYLNSYVQSDLIINHIDDYIVPPRLGDQAGVKGALALALDLDR